MRWQVFARDRAAEALLCNELKLPSLVAAALVARGYSDLDAAQAYVTPSLDALHDPSLLPDYAAARDAILGARERKERIFIHGDYDVDGVTSAALLTRFLKTLGCDVVTHVPHRMKEGYGIHASAVEAARESGAKLFLTCDCGVSAIEQVAMAKEAGMAVVVTDHHTIGEEMPDADAVVNPHRSDSQYPYAELSGAGVAFKLCDGLTRELGHNPLHYYRAYLDLAALGTIADVMPLTGENRIIAKFGLEKLRETKKVGLQALMKTADIDLSAPFRGSHVGWVLGPRLNAAGRVDDAAMALDLLLETDEAQAHKIAEQIEYINQSRKQEQDRILDEAVSLVEEMGLHERNVIVVAKEGWHSGVIGIVAGRIAEKFRRPTFVFAIGEDGTCKGSARSIERFHLADAIRAHPELMTGGGHAMAAGCTFPHELLENVSDALHIYAGQMLEPEDFLPTLAIDAEVDPGEVTRDAVRALNAMEPFGEGNREPVFLATGVPLAKLTPTRKPEHVQLQFKTKAGFVKAIAFYMGDRLSTCASGDLLDVAFKPVIEQWNGNTSLKWQVQDCRAADAPAPQPEHLPFAETLPA